MAQNLQNDFEVLALKLITKEALIKGLANGNKILVECSHHAILGILNHVCVPKLIGRLQTEMTNSKSTIVHAKMSQYLFVLVSLYPLEGVLDKNFHALETYILQCVSDANSEARLNGRKSYLIWNKLAPGSAETLFTQFDLQVQKAVIEEENRFTELEEFDIPTHEEK